MLHATQLTGLVVGGGMLIFFAQAHTHSPCYGTSAVLMDGYCTCATDASHLREYVAILDFFV